MGRFLVGLLVGLCAGGGGVWLWTQRAPTPVVAVLSAPDAGVSEPESKGKKKRRPAGARRGSAGGGAEAYLDEPVPELGPADLRIVAEGDSLSPRPREVDLSDATEVRDLTASEIDDAFRSAAAGITGCITEARGAAPVNGRIEVGLVVTAEGRVSGSRVEAPAYLQQRGLYRCVKREVARLRFPAAGKDTVVRVPFDLS